MRADRTLGYKTMFSRQNRWSGAIWKGMGNSLKCRASCRWSHYNRKVQGVEKKLNNSNMICHFEFVLLEICEPIFGCFDRWKEK